MKEFNATIICTCYYNSSIEVPDNMNNREAMEYAKQHLEDFSIGNLEWIGDVELDEENSGL